MNDETYFRLAALLVMALIVPIGVHHRLRAQRVGGPVSRREEGLALLFGLRLGGLAVWLMLLAWLLAPQRVVWAQWPLPDTLRWWGVVLGVAVAPLAFWVFRSLGTNITDTVVVRERHTLVQTGPYRWVRHPLYVVFALMFLSLSLLTANWLITVIGVGVFALLRVRLPKEEAHLLARYGGEYRAYMQRTGRFLPRLRHLTVVAVLVLAAGAALAADAPPDKSQYHLFNPTPPQWLRDMSTDRPDKTESAYTVDAGHFQVEMDLVSFSYDKYNPDRDGKLIRSWNIAPMNLKVGLRNDLDIQFVVQPHTYERTADPAAGVSKKRGFNDFITRVKWNLWGNDGGTTAFALMPYLKLPTNQDRLGNRSVEGGLIAPLAVELPAGWGMGLMTQLDIVRNAASSGYHPEFVNTVTFSHDIIGGLGGYVEFFSKVSPERGSEWEGTVDLGLTYALTKNIQLDAGINLGVTRSADDWNPFVGVSWRF